MEKTEVKKYLNSLNFENKFQEIKKELKKQLEINDQKEKTIANLKIKMQEMKKNYFKETTLGKEIKYRKEANNEGDHSEIQLFDNYNNYDEETKKFIYDKIENMNKINNLTINKLNEKIESQEQLIEELKQEIKRIKITELDQIFAKIKTFINDPNSFWEKMKSSLGIEFFRKFTVRALDDFDMNLQEFDTKFDLVRSMAFQQIDNFEKTIKNYINYRNPNLSESSSDELRPSEIEPRTDKELLLVKLESKLKYQKALIDIIQKKIFEPPMFNNTLKNEITNCIAERLKCNLFFDIYKYEEQISAKAFGPYFEKEVNVSTKDFHSYLVDNEFLVEESIECMLLEDSNNQDHILHNSKIRYEENKNEMLNGKLNTKERMKGFKHIIQMEDCGSDRQDINELLNSKNLKGNKNKPTNIMLLEQAARLFVNLNGNTCNNSPINTNKSKKKLKAGSNSKDNNSERGTHLKKIVNKEVPNWTQLLFYKKPKLVELEIAKLNQNFKEKKNLDYSPLIRIMEGENATKNQLNNKHKSNVQDFFQINLKNIPNSAFRSYTKSTGPFLNSSLDICINNGNENFGTQNLKDNIMNRFVTPKKKKSFSINKSGKQLKHFFRKRSSFENCKIHNPHYVEDFHSFNFVKLNFSDFSALKKNE